ncbi:glycerophosphodiester phosphodiesterase family protein [Pontibacter mangrovi]|uniref:Glycerophosphodiester phosphodiesterase family protein n=2 Tax=Pontibacter mangrovi TaxID=2589816 RepID=A0A501W5B0_9BACT|nr:glycerophosphodiester phosphodiesterase family protein [Pontibacter mangrovi]
MQLRPSWLLIGICLAFFSCAASKVDRSPQLNTLRVKSSGALREFFHFSGQGVPLISGHRGGTEGYPENSLATFKNTLRHTPAFFEVDPRLTKDSVIVLMHDATLDRTTTGSGKVSDYTWAELQQLRLKDREGNITEHRIPTLEEVIAWSRGKTILNLDKKDVPLEMTAALLEKHKAAGHVMVTVHNAAQAKFYFQRNPELMFSAFVKTKEALQEYERAGVPWSHMIAYIGPENKPENKEMYDLLHARGVMCMISAASTYDRLSNPVERRKAYQEIFTGGADILETDLPVEAAASVKALVPATSAKHKFFKFY